MILYVVYHLIKLDLAFIIIHLPVILNKWRLENRFGMPYFMDI